jgi:hypothetical protein
MRCQISALSAMPWLPPEISIISLGSAAALEHAPAVRHRHDAVGIAVEDEQRRIDRHDVVDGVELVQHQQAQGHEPVVQPRNVERRGEGRLQDELRRAVIASRLASWTATPLPSDSP